MSDHGGQTDRAGHGIPTRRGLIGAGAASAVTGALLAASGGSAAAGPSLRKRRERIVRKHLRSENEQRFGETLETMDPPRYEVIPTGDLFRGRKEVLGFYQALRAAFPDQRVVGATLRHADDAVIAEYYLVGTFLGALEGFEPTGKRFKVRTTAFFLFNKGGARMITERIYFDLYTFLQQLGLLKTVADANVVYPINGGIPIRGRR